MGCAKQMGVRKGGLCAKKPENGVISKLISKAERRKRTAETFHVYAVLQSTICRLKMDDVVLRCKGKQFDDDLVKLSTSNPENSDDQCVGESSFQDDPLHLNSFFRRLSTDRS
jgi:hypothetical protein